MKKSLIIAGPSAVGKTTVAKALIERHPEFELVRSMTSRPPRGDEHDAEYIYVTDAEFEALLSSGGILEHTEYASHSYGTPLSEIERIDAAGKTPLLILDLAGVKSLVTREELSACAVYIYEDIRVIDQRLYDRYLGEAPTVDGLVKYTRRKEQNNADYIAAPDFQEQFYAFAQNGGSPEQTADEIFSVFSDFSAGAPRDEGKISLAVDAMLSSLKSAYMQP